MTKSCQITNRNPIAAEEGFYETLEMQNSLSVLYDTVPDSSTQIFNFPPLELADWSLLTLPGMEKENSIHCRVEFLAIGLRIIAGCKFIR